MDKAERGSFERVFLALFFIIRCCDWSKSDIALVTGIK
jgi:hypothetical protein